MVKETNLSETQEVFGGSFLRFLFFFYFKCVDVTYSLL